MPVISLMLLYNKNVYVNYIVFVILFGLFCGLRGEGVDLDYLNYFYLWFRDYNINELFIEPVSKLIFNVVYSIGLHFNIALIIFSISSLYFIVKSCLSKKINVALYFIIYSGYFLLIQNMMQIRVSLALSVFLYAIVTYGSNNKKSILLMIISVLCHQSMVLLVGLFAVLYPFSKKHTLLYYLSFVAIIFQIQSIFRFDYLELFLGLIVDLFSNDKLTAYYQSYLLNDEVANVFNTMHFLNVLLYFICIFIINKEKINDASIIFSINLMSIGIIIFNVFFKLPAFSFRISEMMFFFLPFTLAFCIKKLDIRSKFFAVLLIFTISLFSIYKVVFETQYIGSYHTFL